MKTPRSKWLRVLSISACVLCCTLPVIGSVIGLTALASPGIWLEKAAILFLVVALGSYLAPLFRKFRAKTGSYRASCDTSCATDCGCSTATNSPVQEETLQKL